MTPLLDISLFYAGLLGLFFFALSVRTLRQRRRFQVGIGDGGHAELQRAIRVHANCAEYVPLILLILVLLDLGGSPNWLVHLFGACLVLGRLSHAFGVREVKENYRFRIFGMAMTFTALVGGSVALLLNPFL
ncbi:MAG: MAPEG family protein [Pseudomonadota bacterium]